MIFALWKLHHNGANFQIKCGLGLCHVFLNWVHAGPRIEHVQLGLGLCWVLTAKGLGWFMPHRVLGWIWVRLLVAAAGHKISICQVRFLLATGHRMWGPLLNWSDIWYHHLWHGLLSCPGICTDHSTQPIVTEWTNLILTVVQARGLWYHFFPTPHSN